eukprot:CAMPEP_0202872098 /NCGR_PEP_ID=MMETSP1391-20130828/20392_1 /ASSEMBLY_ACC=CAM_ASM_000867 /TAXON_ID=1034604 /ORGANISM="Chlamydomonas leiostraca, Strain SAG 11-49" /LENGTH=42 /DNA_ID= /DNA_START= /DNA_END= /DNA_ORIENTATION=
MRQLVRDEVALEEAVPDAEHKGHGPDAEGRVVARLHTEGVDQ